MDPCTCGYVLDGLVETGSLMRTSDGQYCRVDYMPATDRVMSL
jgi:hypothetical protein